MSSYALLGSPKAENTSSSAHVIRQLRRRRPFFRRRHSHLSTSSSVPSREQVLTVWAPTSASSSATSITQGIPRFSRPVDGFIPSLELVSTGAFIFSGPELDQDSPQSSRSWSETSLDIGNMYKDRLDVLTTSPERAVPSSHINLDNSDLHQPQQPYKCHSTQNEKPLYSKSANASVTDTAIDFPSPNYNSVVASLLEYVDHNTYKSLRICSRAWERSIALIKPPRFPAVYNMPRELIQQVYSYLGPSDFDAARHTCHAWYLASFDRPLLHTMLQRGGWLSGAMAEVTSVEAVSESSRMLLRQPEFLACKFARECALLPTWCDDGLRNSLSTDLSSPISSSAAMTLTTYTDMTELSSGNPTPGSTTGCGLSLSVSVCNRFLLATEGCTVYVYELDGSEIRLVTEVICPRRVLATSMDTSAKRYSLAALLDSRMGLVCDLEAEFLQKEIPSPPVYGDNSLSDSRIHQRESSIPSHDINGDTTEVSPHDNDDQTAVASSSNSLLPVDRISSIHIRSPHQSVSLFNASQESERRAVNQTWSRSISPRSRISSGWRPNLSNTIPLIPGPLSIYHSLCSPDDPPRSVAICPSRRCLAFGCSAGIELHWVDALSARNLMKWFPLTATSDFLYFLPTRRGVDNPNKLRLISSKAGPGQRGGIDRYARKAGGRRYGLSWSSLRFGNGSRENDYDHFAAVPISDGSHILFTDPTTGRLYLGSDAPLGGPTKLLRKIVFVPPDSISTSKEEPSSVYAAGTDLTWGVRVVAAYGDSIVLYCLPPDIFSDITKLNGNSIPAVDDRVHDFGLWKEWWDFSDAPKGSLSRASSSRAGLAETSNSTQRLANWPIPVHGIVIGRAPGVVDIAVQSWPNLVVWAFGVDGTARTWEIGDGSKPEALQRLVTRRGRIVDAMDRDGDWTMRDASTSHTSLQTFENFADGGAGYPDLGQDDDSEMIDATSPYLQPEGEDTGAGPAEYGLPTRDARFAFDGAWECDPDGDVRMGNTQISLDRVADSESVQDMRVQNVKSYLVNLASSEVNRVSRRRRSDLSSSSTDSGYYSGTSSRSEKSPMDGVYEYDIDGDVRMTGIPLHVDAAVSEEIEMVDTTSVHQPEFDVLNSAAPDGALDLRGGMHEPVRRAEAEAAAAATLPTPPSSPKLSAMVSQEPKRMVQHVTHRKTTSRTVNVPRCGPKKFEALWFSSRPHVGSEVVRWTETVVEEVAGIEVEILDAFGEGRVFG